jgi:hypothetical protein
MKHHNIVWMDRGVPPRVTPNPRYPDGVPEVDISGGAKRTCRVELPYPSGHVNVGTWLIKCTLCRLNVGITAASRADDARAVVLPCKIVDADQ